MNNNKDKLNQKFKESKINIKDNDMKEVSQGKLKQFFTGIKNGKRIPILIASFLIMLILFNVS